LRLLLIGFVVCGVMMGDVRPAWAQTATDPPRVTGGLFGGRRPVDPNHPDRSSQQVTFDLDLAGGYDQNLGIDEGTLANSGVQQSGAIGTANGEFGYRVGTSQNYLNSSARANTSFAAEGVQQLGAGEAQLQTAIRMGRRAALAAGVTLAYEPTYLFNAFGGLTTDTPDGVVPGASLTEGFTEQRWLAARGFGSVHRNWTPRQRTDVGYGQSQRKPVTGEGLDSNSRSASLRHDWSYRPTATLQFSYQYDENQQVGDTAEPLPLRTHRAVAGMHLEHRLGPNRAVAFNFAGGATRSRTRQTEETNSVEFTVPSGAGGIQLRLSERWSFSLDVNRSVTVLEGLSPQPFNTNAASLVAEARFGRSVLVNATGAYARGAASFGNTGAFQTSLASTELRYQVSRGWALTTVYSYYDHILSDVEAVQSGFPSRHRRNSVRLGVSIWLPLFGSFRDN